MFTEVRDLISDVTASPNDGPVHGETTHEKYELDSYPLAKTGAARCTMPVRNVHVGAERV